MGVERTGPERGVDAEQPAQHRAPSAPPPHVAAMLALQRSAGNQAVARLLAREPAAPAAAARWEAPFDLGSHTHRADATNAIDLARDELRELCEAGFKDAEPLLVQAGGFLDAMPGNEPLTAEEVQRLSAFTTEAARVKRTALAELKADFEQQLAGIDSIADQAALAEQWMAEKLHDAFMNTASEAKVAKAKEALGAVKKYAGEAKGYCDDVKTLATLIKQADKLAKLKEVATGIEGKAGKALELLDLGETVLELAGAVNETPGQFQGMLKRFEKGLSLADAAVTKAAIPMYGAYWGYLKEATAACLQGVRSIVKVVDALHTNIAAQEWAALAASGGGPPTIPTDPGSWTNLQQTFPGGQPMLNLMWNLMRDDGAVDVWMTPKLEDYFVNFRKGFNAGEKDEIETDFHVWDPTSWVGRSRSPNLKRWLVAHKANVWAQLYGGLPHP